MTAKCQNPIFQDETKAREALEATRWPNGPYCPHCGNSDQDRIAEFEFRYNNRSGLGIADGERTALAMKGIEGKRLTYRPTN